MTVHGMRLFSMGLIVLSAAIANAQSDVVAPPDLSSVAVVPAEAPVYPKRPAELPPKLPKVTCQGDQITISADNSTLDAVLSQVKGCTGAKIDIPQGASQVRAFEELGPGPVRKVLDELLSGTPYNYVIESSEANPLRVEKVMLSMRASDSDKPGVETADVPLSNGRQLWKRMQKFDKPDPASIKEDGTPVDGEPVLASENIAATPEPGDSNGAQPAAAGEPPAPDASASVAPPITPVAPPIIEPGSTTDPAKAVQDRISSMQELFNQRQKMMQKQNQPPGSSPNN